MFIFKTLTLPTSSSDLSEIQARSEWLQKVAQNPGIFLLEVIGLVLMIVGTLTVGDWAYQIGYAIGSGS